MDSNPQLTVSIINMCLLSTIAFYQIRNFYSKKGGR